VVSRKIIPLAIRNSRPPAVMGGAGCLVHLKSRMMAAHRFVVGGMALIWDA